MSFVGRGGKPFYHRTLVKMPVSRQADMDGRRTREFQQIYRTGVQDAADDLSLSRFSPAVLVVNCVLRSLNVDASGVTWRGEERHWQCRLMNGACSGLLIEASKTAAGAIHITLTPPNETIHRQLLEIQAEITRRLTVFGDVDIKVRHGHTE